MRGILTKEQKDKKIRRNQLIIGLILIIVMVFGTIGTVGYYAFGDKSDDSVLNYKGIEFVKSNDYWLFNIQGYDFMTKYNPQEVENITFISYLSINDYASKPLYLVSGFNEPNYEISRNLNSFVLRTQNACISEDDCMGSLPIKNCSADNVVIIKEANNESRKESIYQQDNCIFITSSIENQTKYADAFLFKILGV